LASNDSKLQQIIAGDSSSRMLHIAQKINHPSIQFSTILLNDKFDFKNLPDLDCITCSLGLMYLEDVGNILDQFYVAMKGKGILIASVWPHYTKVPFLRILKQVNQKMGSGSVKEASYFENEDASFSFWRQSMVQELLLKHKFEITEWFEVDMPMQYQEPVQVVQFSSEVVEWFSKERENGVRYCTELIKNELGKDPIWPFTLQNKGVVFVAKCIL
jgi:SAM-dependent methyltransferase